MEQAQQIAPLAMSVEEASRVIGFSRSMLYELIAKGELKTFKVGRRRLVQMGELKSFIERASREGAQ